jgi:hypothetical protein
MNDHRLQRRVSLLLAGALLAGTLPRTAQAWGATGHRVVGRIAEAHLSREARRAIKGLLGRETLAEVATWPDDIRSDPAWSHSKPWHFVTIEEGKTYQESKDGDAVEAIRRFKKTLQDRDAKKKERVIALKWIVHLVGDVHQPLHVGRGGDYGGNAIKVKWFGKDSNLHSVWDDGMIDATKLSFSELARFADKATEAQVAEWQKSDVLDWVQESIRFRTRAYTVPGPKVSDSYRYSYVNLPLVKLRLAQAGIRLAGLLNEVLAPSGERGNSPRREKRRAK